ncbi:hypothetical protein HD597_002544 [Nonomuraea thailandensis]|uniref:Uncharacterized protein n=1 Tax=Nonomuraea thailandensis TaxID=1188745 RepID=A0A9X2K0Q4_9ACTN|nr:hypothetical protein [Nonomuraea thailandensis]
MAPAALIAPSQDVPPALNSPKFAVSTNSRPTVAMNSSGMNFSTVATIWNAAKLRSPMRLTSAGRSSPVSAMTIDHPTSWPVFQNTST